MAYHLKDGYNWTPDTTILMYQIELVMFLSRCLISHEINYNPSELEVACLVWCCKQLRTLLHSSRYRIVVLTDHDSICDIVNWTSLDIVSTNRANRRLVNILVYLAAYPLDVYHFPGRLNLVLDVLLYFKMLEDAEIWQYDEEPMLDIFWDEVLSILFLSEV